MLFTGRASIETSLNFRGCFSGWMFGAPEFEDVDRREIERAEVFLCEFEEVAFFAELGGELIGDEPALIGHRIGYAGKDFASGIFFDDGKREARDDIVTVGVSERAERLPHVDGIGLKNSDTRVTGELFFQVGGESGVEFEEKKTGVGIHSFDNLPGMATFAGAEFHHHAGTREVQSARGLSG